MNKIKEYRFPQLSNESYIVYYEDLKNSILQCKEKYLEQKEIVINKKPIPESPLLCGTSPDFPAIGFGLASFPAVDNENNQKETFVFGLFYLMIYFDLFYYCHIYSIIY